MTMAGEPTRIVTPEEHLFYTDASYSPQEAKGAWAWVLIECINNTFTYAGHDTGICFAQYTSSGQLIMELQAIYMAIKSCRPLSKVFIYSDNTAAVDLMSGKPIKIRESSIVTKGLEHQRSFLGKQVVVHWKRRQSDVFSGYANKLCNRARVGKPTQPFVDYRRAYEGSLLTKGD